jgi:hypothetical protein
VIATAILSHTIPPTGFPAERWYTARMTTKRKSKKKPSKAKKIAGKKAHAKKAAKSATRKAVASPKKKPVAKATPKKASGKAKPASKKRVRGKSESVDTVVFAPVGLGARSGGQSGDLQGLTNREGANSESVGELLEEGNAFEAEVVKGVEDAGDADEREVHTHEVPEDDVPGEYLGKDE